MSDYRKEHDFLGERDVPAAALYGIHTLRAVENFPLARRPVHPELVHAYGAVKLACARTNRELGSLSERVAVPIEQACAEMMEGMLDSHVIVDALQGGAGTSTNMNVNEVLANRALQILGRPLGEYDTLSPADHVNLHQSTNDTYPTALRIAAIRMLRSLEREVVALLEEFQRQEKAMADVVKVGRTQFQDAVLLTLGREMAAYAEALGRDRWRIYKCEERLRVVNLGGTAVGTGLDAPRQFIFKAVEHLRDVTGLGLARAENLVEATQNADVFVEVSGILKACASNLIKISSDLRLLSSGPEAGLGEIRLPPRQAGSSIMPGKVNPVIPEAVTQAALAVCANDQAITSACSMGSLELNAFLPLVADCLLTNLDLLARGCNILRRHCVAGIEADAERCRKFVNGATASLTALVETLGYDKAVEVARLAADGAKSVRQVVLDLQLMSEKEFDDLTAADRVNQLGSRPRRQS
ncbi:MAG: aspartate ammonia-lyase [Planctomycetaceae bacterium]|nr:aspartate ammonia-lyase [Planctomycetaceae bacterium]